MAIQIKIRRDTKAEWDSADPVLLAGELGFELKDSATSGRFKIGNGSREWSRLPFWYAYQDSAGNYPSAGGAASWYGDRGLFHHGQNPTNYGAGVNNLDYVDITTPGNATDFGDLTQARYYTGSTSNYSRGVWTGGASTTNVIQYVTIDTPSNATDFGDLLTALNDVGATSGSPS